MALIAWLFYGRLWLAPVLIPIGIVFYKQDQEQQKEKKLKLFEKQFQDALQTLEGQLNIGYSMENAIKEVQKELLLLYKPEARIVQEFTYMVRQLNLNITAEQAWKDFADRICLQQVDSFVTIFVQAKRAGGDSIMIIRRAVRQLGEKADIKREIDTVIASKRMEFVIMSIVPFAIIGYMRLCFPDFMSVLYDEWFGLLFMTGCLTAYLAAWKLGMKIVEIEVQ